MNFTYEILVHLPEENINTSIWTEIELEDFSPDHNFFLVRFQHNNRYDISSNMFGRNT